MAVRAMMVDKKKQGRLGRSTLVTGGVVLLLFATITLLFADLQNWPFTTASNYTFDSTKIEVSDGLVKLKPVPPSTIHDEEAEFSGTQSNTRWLTDHIELDPAGLSTGSGTYTSPTIDSGAAGTEWGTLSWTETVSQGSARFSATKSMGTISGGKAVYGADIDGDNDVDVVAVQEGSPFILYFENNGADNFTQRVISNEMPPDARDVHVADINQDGRLDFVVIASASLEWYQNLGGMPPAWARQAIAQPSSGNEVEVADVNGDGNLDVVIGDDSSVKWYESDGANPPTWTVRTLDSTLSAVDALSTGDLDDDGDLDLLVGDEKGLYWYESDGAGSPRFTKRSIDKRIVRAESIIAADLNNDGKLDVVGVGRDNTDLSWYENNGATPPGFTRRTIDSGPLSKPVSVPAGDLDRDGDLDLVLVTEFDVHWYRNDGGAPLTWTKTALTTGTVNLGDHLFLVNLGDDNVKGDDDLDIVLAEETQVSWWENLLPHSNVRFQLRTSADGTTWSSWQGPEGRTTSSYTDPWGGETITVPNGRYLQYQVFFRAHDSISLNVQLSMVRLDPANQLYPTDNPTIQNVTGQDFTSITSFTETLGAGSQGLVRYQISNNGTTWYYNNGSLWAIASAGLAHTNSAAEVNALISSFNTDVGPGTFYFKAFLNSDGTQQVELDQIEIDTAAAEPAVEVTTGRGQPAAAPTVRQSAGKTSQPSVTLTINNSSGPLEVFVGSPLTLSWTSTGTDTNNLTPCIALTDRDFTSRFTWQGEKVPQGEMALVTPGPAVFSIRCETTSGSIVSEEVKVTVKTAGYSDLDVLALPNGKDRRTLRFRKRDSLALSWSVFRAVGKVSCFVSDSNGQVYAQNLPMFKKKPTIFSGSYRVLKAEAGKSFFVKCIDEAGAFVGSGVQLNKPKT